MRHCVDFERFLFDHREPCELASLSTGEINAPALSGFGIMDGKPDRRMILARPFDAVF